MSNDDCRESFPENVRAAWKAEICRRLQEIEDGTVVMIPWDDARTMILSAEHPERQLSRFLTGRSKP